MPRSRMAFRLKSKLEKSGSRYWTILFYDPVSGRQATRSTGIVDDGGNSYTKAWNLGVDLFGRQRLTTAGRVLFSEAAQDFWVWEKSSYLKAILARDPKAISPETASNYRSLMKNYGIPMLGSRPVESITSADLDDVVTDLLTSGLSSQSVKHFISSISPVFQWLLRNRAITTNPVHGMLPFVARQEVYRDAFTPDECRKLLDPSRVPELWGADFDEHTPESRRKGVQTSHNPYRLWAANVLEAVTGNRVSSVLALKREDIRECWTSGKRPLRYYQVELKNSVKSLRGIQPGSKTGRGTTLPVPAEVMELILPHLPETGLLFASRGKHGVVSAKTVGLALRAALKRIGITEADRTARALGNHSWRHTWETRAKAAGLDADVRHSFTEHTDEKTSQRYTHLAPADLLAALPVQRALLK